MKCMIESCSIMTRIICGSDDERVILINSFSKTYAMTGWRISYIMSANKDAMNQMIKLQYFIQPVLMMQCGTQYLLQSMKLMIILMKCVQSSRPGET